MISLKRLRAFTLPEVFAALGLIGILCITMLSLNSMTDNNYKVASEKLAQTDSSLKIWGKIAQKTDEAELKKEIKDQASLVASLKDFFTNKKMNKHHISAAVKSEVSDYKGSTEIDLSNGTTLKVKYIDTKDTSNVYNYAPNNSVLAIIKAESKVKGKDMVLEEEYVFSAKGLKSLEVLYEGWDVYEFDKAEANKHDKKSRWFCNDKKGCIPSDNESSRIYVNSKNTVSCGNNQTGSIITMTIGTGLGTYNSVINTCCAAPKIFKERKNDVNICVCPDNIAKTGYIIDNNSPACLTLVSAGAYAVEGKRILCGHTSDDDLQKVEKGYYCPNDGMLEPIICPKGSYCPNAKPSLNNEERRNYHSDVFYKEGNEEKVYQGGLKKPVKCPDNFKCDEEGLINPK